MRKQWCLQSVTISVEVTLQQPIGSSLNTSRSTAYKADARTVSLNWMLKTQVWLSKFYEYIPRWNLYTCWEKTLSKESRVSCSFSSFTKVTFVSATFPLLPLTWGERLYANPREWFCFSPVQRQSRQPPCKLPALILCRSTTSAWPCWRAHQVLEKDICKWPPEHGCFNICIQLVKRRLTLFSSRIQPSRSSMYISSLFTSSMTLYSILQEFFPLKISKIQKMFGIEQTVDRVPPRHFHRNKSINTHRRKSMGPVVFSCLSFLLFLFLLSTLPIPNWTNYQPAFKYSATLYRVRIPLFSSSACFIFYSL